MKTTYCDWTSSNPVCGERATAISGWKLCDFHADLVKRWQEADHAQRLAIVDSFRASVPDVNIHNHRSSSSSN